jgi:dTMP kinase
VEYSKVLDWIINRGYLKKNCVFYISKAIEYATFLQTIYGGDKDVIEIGTVLSETKEVNNHFEKLNKGLSEIREVLSSVGLIEERVNFLFNCINSIDGVSSIEERIIRDSCQMSWYGMTGILKLLEYSENEGITIVQIASKLNIRNFPYFFPETSRIVEKEKKFTHFFLGTFSQNSIFEESYEGKYIILEGNSGVGKDIQAERLEKNLTALGKKVIVVQEPSTMFRNLEKNWNRENAKIMSLDQPILRMYGIIGDRQQQIMDKTINALKKGFIVISVRSYLSMLVYQCETEINQLYVNYLHQFVPKPDCVIIYDLDEQTCYKRINERGGNASIYDKLSNLKKNRPKYLELIQSSFLDFPIEIINTTGSIEEIALKTLNHVRKYIE